jgi:tRNA(fMet)-specific endonuclease VapC
VVRVRAYARLHRSLHFYQQWGCLPFDEAAAAIFDQLRTQKLRLGTNDLAIAAITLAVRGILVIRNTVDFQRIPGLVQEDWTRS